MMLPSLMRRHLSLVLATLFILLGGFVFPVVYLLWMIQQPELVPRTVDPQVLYALTIPGVVIELEKDRGIRALDGTILELNRQDITRILTANFSEKDVVGKAEETIRSIATTMETAPPDTFQFWINLKDERPVVNDYLLRYFRHKLVARPECSMGKFLGMAWMGVQKLFGKRMGEDEQLRRLPRCRPPKEVQDAVMKAVAARLHQDEAKGVDSIRARPNFSPKAHRFVRRTLAIGREGALLIPVLPVLLGGIILLSWRNRRHCYARLAAPLLITSMILLVISIPIFVFSRDMDLFETFLKIKPIELSESTGQWLRVTFYLVKVMWREASYNLAIIGGVMLAIGLILTRQHRRCKATIVEALSIPGNPTLVAASQTSAP